MNDDIRVKVGPNRFQIRRGRYTRKERLIKKAKEILKYEFGSSVGIADNLVIATILAVMWSAGLTPWMWQFWVLSVLEGLRLGICRWRTKNGQTPPF